VQSMEENTRVYQIIWTLKLLIKKLINFKWRIYSCYIYEWTN
jgi:hypothetical protein